MSGRYLLDTNVVIALFAGEPEVRARFDDAPEIFLSPTVLGELLYGAYHSVRLAANSARVEEFAVACSRLVIDDETGRRYAEIRKALRNIGKPIPENDIWIAATALRYGLTLVTRDGHFKEVSGLPFVAW
ncbi:MAG TPA: type II toxin-antitoxin system VapC family toxin [Thermoanaerobaculia bacterium]|nr:type II toxin-antitoxin system VapC family toxin [Thermoanaerobaculia bacterium]